MSFVCSTTLCVFNECSTTHDVTYPLLPFRGPPWYSLAACVIAATPTRRGVQPLRPDCTTHLERSARQTISCVCGFARLVLPAAARR